MKIKVLSSLSLGFGLLAGFLSACQTQIMTTTPVKETTTLPTKTNTVTITPTPTLTLTPIPSNTPTRRQSWTATPVYETYQQITVENGKSAQIVDEFIPPVGKEGLYDLDFSPLGGLLATVNGLGELQLWRFTKDGTHISMQDYKLDVSSGFEGKIRKVAFSPDGKDIVSGETSEHLIFRDLATGIIFTQQLIDIDVDDLVYSPDLPTGRFL